MTKMKSAPAIGRQEDEQVVSPIASTISAVSYRGLSVMTPEGMPATLAVIDQDGKVIDAGPSVTRAVWDVAIRSYRNFLSDKGILRVRTISPDQQTA